MTGAELIEAAAILTAAVVSIVGAYISIRNRKSDSRKVQAETNLTETQQSQIVQRLAESTEEMYLKRIESFKDDIKLLRDELDATRQELTAVRSEAGLLEDFFFNYHQPWDRQFVQQARERGWEVSDPPSWLVFLREHEKRAAAQ